jgi:hypothetical protein
MFTGWVRAGVAVDNTQVLGALDEVAAVVAIGSRIR